MHINSNLNSLVQLEKKLEESTRELARLNQNGDETSTKQKNSGENLSTKHEKNDKDSSSTDDKEQQTKRDEIPLSYSVDHNVVSVQSSAKQTVLDIVV